MGSGSNTSGSGSSMSGSTGSSSTLGSSFSQTGSGSMSRVSKDSVDNRLTAKDLIGAAVYDPAGERIGDIADIDLRGAVPSSLSMSFKQGQSDADSSSTYGSTNRTGSSTTSGTTTGRSTTTAQPGTYAQSGSQTGMGSSSTGTSGSGSSSMGSSNRSTTGSTGSSATDALRDSSRAAVAGIDSALSSPTVFLSVGGLFGIGDDLVSVPISMLNYNTSKDHFELSASKAEVTALTEAPDRNSSYASNSGSMNSGSGSSSMNSTTAGKQSFGDEVTRVQSALRTDPKTSSFAHNVMVSSDGDTLELRGSVDSKDQKQQIVDCARRATSLKIDDSGLDVRK